MGGRSLLHIGNIDWAQCASLAESAIREALRDIEIISLVIEPLKGNRARDVGRKHGGFAVLELDEEAADSVMQMVENITFGDKRMTCSLSKSMAAQTTETSLSLDDEAEKKRQHSRSKMKNRKIRLEGDLDDILARVGSEVPSLFQFSRPVVGVIDQSAVPKIDWANVPAPVDPVGGGGLKTKSSVLADRGARKRLQAESFFQVAFPLLGSNTQLLPTDSVSKKFKVVDFGCGTGNLTIPLGYFLHTSSLPVEVVGVDMKGSSIDRLNARVEVANLGVAGPDVVRGVVGRIEEVVISGVDHRGRADKAGTCLENVAMVVSLHACGVATDLTIAQALLAKVPFVVSPCCIGKIKFGDGTGTVADASEAPSAACTVCGYECTWQEGLVGDTPAAKMVRGSGLPRSAFVRKLVSTDEFLKVVRRADSDHAGGNISQAEGAEESKIRDHAARCKALVEIDRCLFAAEVGGYRVALLKLTGHEHFAKSDLMVGVPPGWSLDTFAEDSGVWVDRLLGDDSHRAHIQSHALQK